MFQKVVGGNDERSKNFESNVTPKAAPAPEAASPTPSTGQRNVLSSDVEIKGTIKFTSDLVIDGKVEGEITSEGALTVGENAVLKAEVRTNSVVVYGKIHGNIVCKDRIEIRANAEVVGDITAAVLTMEAGAVFVGRSQIGAPQGASNPVAAPKASAKPAAPSKPAAPKSPEV